MREEHDAVTRWWRSLSLRAKVTGVTVSLLAIGLFAAGSGTMAFLRNALMENVKTSVQQLAPTDLASALIEIENVDGTLRFRPDETAPPAEYSIAIYDPTGKFVVSVGGSSAKQPAFPDTYTLEKTQSQGLEPFTLGGSETTATFLASVDVQPLGGSALYTQMVALPLAPTERVVGNFVGIYSILALLILIASAMLTRWLVTLTFRGLGQVEATAMSIAAGDFSQRMADVVPGTEVGRLKAAINAMLGRVDAALNQRDATVRQMRRFIGDASHELRTPLVTVRGYAELYRMGAIRSEDDIAQSMERIEKEAIRMGVLVEDLLALARLDERRELELSPIDLRPLARDAALDLRAASPQRAVGVIIDDFDPPADEDPPPPEPPASESPDPIAPTEAGRRRASPATSAIAIAGATFSRLRRRPRHEEAGSDAAADAEASLDLELAEPIVLGEENRIRQVIANLLGNARRFTAEDSPIELRVGADAEAGMGWIEVIDHGEGIPEQIRDQIFQRFWRADTSRTRETGGAGLGLSIVASIVDALHGTVAVTDTPGGGATFRVSLPLAVEGQVEPGEPPPVARSRRDGSR